ncbi:MULTISPECIES: hypothetical protein [Pontibacillus]|uniref:DUF3139 domain-containing protein n=1 Tax=Pontibacillus chungwhensis TaxID=265426 RepID=A0ABY8USI8_9BACI|nr:MULTISPECIES: hypothetical protein [Pontibacillus]MCD5323251.1 hypothetical protein [Pontibacillus sp. HN14]WIF96636.1 hypothetical protein QNI29_12835 [Pontibacillus chungwhensis]
MAYLFVAPIAIILIVIGGIKKNKLLLAIGACLAIFFAYMAYTSTPPTTTPEGFKDAETLKEEPGIERLSEYLDDKYPNAIYKMKPQKQGEQSSHYITVVFEDEPEWFYNYLVTEDKITQAGLLAPEGEDPVEGQYFEEEVEE